MSVYTRSTHTFTPVFKFDFDTPCAADAIIARVAADITPPPAKKIRSPRKGLDLSDKRESIAQLLAEVRTLYEIGLDAYSARMHPNKPSLEEVLSLRLGESKTALEAAWRQRYRLPRGNPGTNRHGGPPIPPLHDVYWALRRWWQENGLGKFNPDFKPDEEAEFKAPARFLLGVLEFLNPDYVVENASGLYETMRKRKEEKGSKTHILALYVAMAFEIRL